MKPVESSVLAAIGYDPHHQRLYLEFRDGDVYAYDGVPPKTHDELLDADSIGGYFNTSIRPTYEGRRIGFDTQPP